MSPHLRLRDLGVVIGEFPTGPNNAITDVPGTLVAHTTITYDEPRVARTGMTLIMPRNGDIWSNPTFAAYHSFNGAGEMTGVLWLEESGQLFYPIALTSTHHVGTVHEAIVAYGQEHGFTEESALAVVAETWDGWLSDMDAFHLTRDHVYDTFTKLDSGPVAEGNVGGGTGMICHEFKGGIGTSSRIVETKGGTYTVGVIVQANHGAREDFRVDGVPVGHLINGDHTPKPWAELTQSSSIIIVIGTDAPLLPHQCRRLAKRATIGFARTGGIGHNASGDLFIAFSTGNDLSHRQDMLSLQMIPNRYLNPLFVATAEAVEESIINAVVAAQTMTGWQNRTAYGLPVDELKRVMDKYRWDFHPHTYNRGPYHN